MYIKTIIGIIKYGFLIRAAIAPALNIKKIFISILREVIVISKNANNTKKSPTECRSNDEEIKWIGWRLAITRAASAYLGLPHIDNVRIYINIDDKNIKNEFHGAIFSG